MAKSISKILILQLFDFKIYPIDSIFKVSIIFKINNNSKVHFLFYVRR